jgi:adenylate cyclase
MDRLVRARFRLDLTDERLWDSGSPVRLTRKAFELLRFLVKNPNRLLTRQEIQENLWRGVHVSDGLIKEYVHDLRLALDDDPRNPRLIETVRGRGYRYLGGVDVEEPADSSADSPERTASIPSVAVLPLENLADGERWARFCRGMSDDLITDLSRYPDFVVIAKSSTVAYQGNQADVRGIGRDLGAGYVLGGSMQVSGTKLKMNLHLAETRGGHNVWAERYEREIEDLFAIQSDIVARVVTALGGVEGRITDAERRRIGRKPPDDLEAYELHLLAVELEEKHQKESTLEAFELLRRAVKLDAKLARAWLILGWTCYQIRSEGWAEDRQRFARMEREAYITAARLDPRDPFAVMEQAAVRAVDGDLGGAFDGFERAVDLGSNQADVLATASKYFAMVMDDPARALELMERSLELNPHAPESYFMHEARVAYFLGDYERALGAVRRAPDLQNVRLFEMLSIAQLGRADKLYVCRSAFEARYPGFDLGEFMRDPPIVGPRARALFLDGASKAGLAHY